MNDDLIIKYNENGLYCKEDVLFEMLMYLINRLCDNGYVDINEIEDVYRNAYNTLPFHIELK